MSPAYWIEWARRRGAYYYSERAPWETAEYVAPCVSAVPAEQTAFIEGWHAAEALEC